MSLLNGVMLKWDSGITTVSCWHGVTLEQCHVVMVLSWDGVTLERRFVGTVSRSKGVKVFFRNGITL